MVSHSLSFDLPDPSHPVTPDGQNPIPIAPPKSAHSTQLDWVSRRSKSELSPKKVLTHSNRPTRVPLTQVTQVTHMSPWSHQMMGAPFQVHHRNQHPRFSWMECWPRKLDLSLKKKNTKTPKRQKSSNSLDPMGPVVTVGEWRAPGAMGIRLGVATMGSKDAQPLHLNSYGPELPVPPDGLTIFLYIALKPS